MSIVTTRASDNPQYRKKVSAYLRSRTLASGQEVIDVRWRHEKRGEARTFISLEKAEAWRSILESAGHEVAVALLDGKDDELKPTLNTLAEQYITSRTSLGEDTAHRYRRYMVNSIGPAFGYLPVDAITRDLILEWVQNQQMPGTEGDEKRQPYKEKTIKNRLRFLASVFEYAVERDYIVRNPAKEVAVQHTVYTEMTFLSHAEFNIVYSFIPAHYKPLVLFLVSTGLRWSEATALLGSDIDMVRRQVRVNKAWKWTPNGWVIGPPKTKKSQRTVPFSKDVATSIEGLVRTAGPMGYLFRNLRGGPVRLGSFWDKTWQPALNLANGLPAREYTMGPNAGSPWAVAPTLTPINKRPRIHDLRHTHVSWLIEQGVAFDIVQDRVGHESITTTVDRYGHIDPKRRDAVREALEAFGEQIAPNEGDYDDE